MNIGDIAIPVGNKVLADSTREHHCAIVCSLEPFVLVSINADMLWRATVQPHEFISLCPAHPEVVERCMRRLATTPLESLPSPNLQQKATLVADKACTCDHKAAHFLMHDYHCHYRIASEAAIPNKESAWEATKSALAIPCAEHTAPA